MCRLLGPATRDEGIYGTDLGYTVAQPDGERLAMLFGDTWAEAGDACQYPVTKSDDLQATLPAERPASLGPGAPSSEAQGSVCSTLERTLDDPADPLSWRRIRLFASEADRDADVVLDMSALRTPVTAWNDGSQVFAMFLRGDPAACESSDDCPAGMLCSNDAEQGATALGECPQPFALVEDPAPQLCRDDDDCGAGACDLSTTAVCVSTTPFTAKHDGETIAPSWYRDDARLGVAQTMYIASSSGSERPEDYLVAHRFVTRQFVNVVARTIAHFDPEEPSQNDYAPGDHTLLIWGRPAFVTMHGVQSLPFLLYVPLAELRDAEDSQWRPRFYAGFHGEGRVKWSEVESEAQPIYGTEARVTQTTNAGEDVIEWEEPEFDYVNQMSVSWIAPLSRWVMVYGGDVPAWLVMNADGAVQRPVNVQPAPGAIHQRIARHPWGRATLDDSKDDAWSSAAPLLTRQDAAPYLACPDDEDALPGCTDETDSNSPLDLLATIAGLAADEPSDALDVTGDCLAGSVTLAAQNEASGDPIGRLYGVNIIDEWTQDVTSNVADLDRDERAVEVYWNVSTWNPYQVVLMKTQLRAKP